MESAPGLSTTVRAARAPLAASEQRIAPAAIEAAAPSSGSELMALVPGLRLSQHGAEGKGHQLFLRGFDAVHGADVAVSVAGIPLNERLNVHGLGYLDLYGLIPEVVSALHVTKGCYQAWQGSFATAGSLDFELGQPAALEAGLLRLAADQHGRLRAVGVGALGPLASGGSFAALELVEDPGFGPQRAARRGALNLDSRWRLAPDLTLRLVGLGQLAAWQSPGVLRYDDLAAGRVGFFEAYPSAGDGSSRRWLSRLALEGSAGRLQYRAGLYGGQRRLDLVDDFTGYLLNGPAGDRRQQTQASALAGLDGRLDYRFDLGLPLRLEAGAGWRLDQGREHEAQVERDGRAWRDNRDLLARIHGPWAAIALQATPWRWLTLTPALRGEAALYRVVDQLASDPGARDASRAALLPRLAVRVAPWRALAFFADAGRGFRIPEARAVVAPPAGSIEDQDLAPYRGGSGQLTVADSAELGLRVERERWAASLAAFGTRIARELVFDHVSNTNVELNPTRRVGLELWAAWRPLALLALEGDTVYVDARFERSGKPIPGASPLWLRLQVQAGEPLGPHAGLAATYVAARALAHGARVAGSLLLDAQAGWRWEGVALALVADNLLDSRAFSGAYHYASWFDLGRPRSGLPATHVTVEPPLTVRLVATSSW